jgi:hypothetical protein
MSESFLDMLRNRVAGNMQNEALQRASEFGAGMLASGSPNFFTMLGAGARAQSEGDRTRMDELRRVTDIERQQRAQEAEVQYRNQQLEIERQRRANEERRINAEIARGDRPQYTVIGQDVNGNAIVADMRNPTQRQTLEGVTPMQVASLGARAESAREVAAIRAGNSAVQAAQQQRGLLNGTLSEDEARRIFQAAYQRAMNPEQVSAPAAPTVPVIEVSPVGRPAR